MEKQYYTPEIEEFHVGFEYEDWDNYKKEWYKTTLPTLRELDEDFDMKIKLSLYRVKYLDKEDIKSLGWVYGYKADLEERDTKEHECNVWQYTIRGIYCDVLSNRDVDLKLTYQGPETKLIITFYEKNYFQWYTCFEGEIKNKSELKKLMKQLNIK